MQPIGVTVVSVTLDGVADPTYPLLGSGVDLLDNPVFEGRNGVIAEDGLEPIAPFHLAVRQGTASFSRATAPSNCNPRIANSTRSTSRSTLASSSALPA